jgi:hypothetical protein
VQDHECDFRAVCASSGNRPWLEASEALVDRKLQSALPRGCVNPRTVVLHAALKQRIGSMLESFLKAGSVCLRLHPWLSDIKLVKVKHQTYLI